MDKRPGQEAIWDAIAGLSRRIATLEESHATTGAPPITIDQSSIEEEQRRAKQRFGSSIYSNSSLDAFIDAMERIQKTRDNREIPLAQEQQFPPEAMQLRSSKHDRILYYVALNPDESAQIPEYWPVADAYTVIHCPGILGECIIYYKMHGMWHKDNCDTRWLLRHLLDKVLAQRPSPDSWKRDPKNPCEEYEEGPSTQFSECASDGHYLCSECKHRKVLYEDCPNRKECKEGINPDCRYCDTYQKHLDSQRRG